jgi:hypothetical protein
LSAEFLQAVGAQSHPATAGASNPCVNGKSLLTRILLALGLAMFCLIVFGTNAHATPVEPNIHEILAQPHTPPQPFPLARAGWKGPETAPSPEAAPNPILETFGVAAQRREVERGLRAAAIPDPRAVAAILAAILVLRRAKHQPPKPRLVEPNEAEPIAA